MNGSKFVTLIMYFLFVGCESTHVPESIETIGFTGDESGNAISETSDGGFIIAGSTNSIRGNSDAYAVKTDHDGVAQWSKTFGGDNQDQFFSVSETANGDFLFAGTIVIDINTDMYVLRTDSRGKVLWSRNLGGRKFDEARSIRELTNGDIGVFGTTGSFGFGETDFYLLRLDASGNLLWVKTFGTTLPEFGRDMLATPDGGFIMTGFTQAVTETFGDADVYTVRTDRSGNVLWSKTFDHNYTEKWDGVFDEGHSIIPSPSGGFVIAGRTGFIINRRGSEFRIYSDVLLLHYSAQGTLIFEKLINTTDRDEANRIVGGKNGCYFTGASYTSHESDELQILLGKIDWNGNSLWNKKFGEIGSDIANDLVVSKKGDLRIVGTTKSLGAGKSDVILINTDSEGNLRTR